MNNENIIKIKEEFNSDLQELWEKFEKDSNVSFFQTFKWQKYWFEKCGKNQKNIITLFYKKGELVSILPLNIKRQNFDNILNWNGFPFSDYNQPSVSYTHLTLPTTPYV